MAYYGKRVWLEQARMQKTYSQDRVAAMTDISQAAYSKIENGYSNPRPDVAMRIADVLEFPVELFELDHTGGDKE